MQIQIGNFLNKRFSLRNLSDEQFESVLDTLSEQLVNVDYVTKYSDDVLRKDWRKLCHWNEVTNSIHSVERLGIKLCEHFFPNFYEIENSRGKSFANLWVKDNLKKVLRWNRKSHSTPYLSELKRGIYFCCGLTKNTMYRPQMMRMACLKYQPKIVLDPCSGWGGRLLGATSANVHYIGFEPNTKTFAGLNKIVDFLNLHDKVTLICDDAMNMGKYNLPKVDMILTSPPYYDLEVYSHEATQSISRTQSYEDWSNNFLKALIQLCIERLNDDGISCWNVGKVGRHDMNDDVRRYHSELNYHEKEVLTVLSSKRQSNQTKTKNAKNNDDTVVYWRVG